MFVCHCGSQMSGITMESPGVASVFCVSGHRTYFFKHGGEWETARERQARMKHIFTCQDCKEPFWVADNMYERRFCNVCAERHQEAARPEIHKAHSHKNNSRSPWRMKVNMVPQDAWRKDAINPR